MSNYLKMHAAKTRDKMELSTLNGLKSVAHGNNNEKCSEERGNCVLLKRNCSVSQQKDETDALLRYVLGVDGDGSESPLKSDEELKDSRERCHDGVWVEFEARLQYELDLIGQQQQQQQQQEDTSSFHDDVISRERGACEVSTSGDGCWTVVGLEGFSSVSGRFPKTGGKYMYEAQVQTAGVMQIGWMTPNTIFTSEDGIGDSRDSFAFDGKRVRKWNVSSVHYGERWTAGDVITCGIDLEEKKVEFWRNGTFMGVAFACIPVGSNVEYRPGVSLSYGEAVELNFGSRPLRYPVEGYSTLVDPPPKDKIKKCEYLVACLERLVLYQDGGNAESPGAAAAKAAAQATDMLFSLRTGENKDSIHVEENVQDEGCPSNSNNNNDDVVLKEAAAALGSHLEPLLEIDYLIDLVIPQALNRLKGFSEHDIKMLRRFMEYLLGQVDDQKCGRALHSICECFVRIIKASHVIQEEIYDLPNINALYLWNQFLNIERYRVLWFSGDHWKKDLENLLFIRLPTHKDVETLMPLTSGPEGEDVLGNLEFDSMKDEFKIDAVSDLIGYFSELENCQMDVLVHLFEEENTPSADESHSQNTRQTEEELRRSVESYLELHKNEQVTSAADDSWVSLVVNVLNSRTTGVPERLVAFFSYLCEKNGRSRRDIPPPNMSHKSVLASFLSFTLRGTRPFLMSNQVKGKNFNFPAQIFLQGVRSEVSSSSDEHLQIDSRVGGNLSYLVKKSLVELCRTTPLTLEVPSLPSSLCRDDWYISRSERPVAMFLKGDPCWSWWFIVASFTMYHFGAENLLKMNHRYLQTFEAALGSFRALGDRLEDEEENSTTEFLKFSLRECKKTMLESLRQSIWYLTWLMPSWKQETLAATASAMSRILSSAVKDTSQLITFVPEFYVTAVLDMIQNCRRADQRSWPDSGYIYSGYFSSVLDVCLEISMDVRLKSPEVQSSILHTIWLMLKEEDTCEFISKSNSAQRLLFPCLIEAFTSSQNWIHASNGFGLLVQSSGMSPRIASLVLGEENLLHKSQKVIQGWLGEFLESNQELSCKLLDSLIERINWISTEIISLVEDLSKALMDNSLELDSAALLYRRTQAAFDLCYHLCRLLEFICSRSPKSILDSTANSELLCTRLAEFLAWGVKSFGENSHVSHEIDLIYENSAEKLGHYGSSIQLATSIEILAPMLGVLSSLQRKSSKEEITSQSIHLSTSQEVSSSKSCNISDQWHKMLHNLHDLGLTSVELRQALLSISEEDTSGLIEPAQQDVESIKIIVKAFECMEADKLKRAAIVQDLQPAPSIPDEFLDPILNILMTEPVILPDSKVTLDRKTIQRHLKNSQTDPFSRKELTEDELIPNDELKAKLMEWLAISQQQQQQQHQQEED